MPYLELPLMSKIPDISKLPGLLSSSTLALRRSLFGKPCVDAFVSSRRSVSASGNTSKGLSVQPVSRQVSARIQSVQRQAMSLKQYVPNLKPVSSSPLWEIAGRLGSAYRSVQGQLRGQLDSLPGYYERAAAPVRKWWQELWGQEKPLPTLPKEEIPSPVVIRPHLPKSVSGRESSTAVQPLRIEKQSGTRTVGFKVRRNPPEPLKHSAGQADDQTSATGHGFDDLIESIETDIKSWNSGGNAHKASEWSRPNQHSFKPHHEDLSQSNALPIEEPVVDLQARDGASGPVRRYRPESYTEESRTILDDLLADLRAGIYPPRRSGMTARVKRTWCPDTEMPPNRQSVSDTGS